MGWSSGNEVFDPVARVLIEMGVSNLVLFMTCKVLIQELQQRGWDTEDESFKEFRHYPVIVAAFAANGIPGPDWEEEG